MRLLIPALTACMRAQLNMLEDWRHHLWSSRTATRVSHGRGVNSFRVFETRRFRTGQGRFWVLESLVVGALYGLAILSCLGYDRIWRDIALFIHQELPWFGLNVKEMAVESRSRIPVERS